MEYIIFSTLLVVCLGLAAVFAPRSRKASVKAPLPEEEEEVFYPEDLEDTQPFIRLPFFCQAEEDDTQRFTRTLSPEGKAKCYKQAWSPVMPPEYIKQG
jgi:hypothetical protein